MHLVSAIYSKTFPKPSVTILTFQRHMEKISSGDYFEVASYHTIWNPHNCSNFLYRSLHAKAQGSQPFRLPRLPSGYDWAPGPVCSQQIWRITCAQTQAMQWNWGCNSSNHRDRRAQKWLYCCGWCHQCRLFWKSRCRLNRCRLPILKIWHSICFGQSRSRLRTLPGCVMDGLCALDLWSPQSFWVKMDWIIFRKKQDNSVSVQQYIDRLYISCISCISYKTLSASSSARNHHQTRQLMGWKAQKPPATTTARKP